MFRRQLIGSVRRSLSTATETITRAEPQCVDNLTQIGTRRIFDFEHDQCKLRDGNQLVVYFHNVFLDRQMCRLFYKDKVVPFTNEWYCFYIDF